MKLLSGQVRHTLDAKYRVRIPAKYKDAFGEQPLYFVSFGEKCIFVLPDCSLQERLQRFASVTTADGEVFTAKSRILSNIEEVEIDKQGRTVIPLRLREQVGIKKNVVTVGMGDFIEIWSEEKFLEEEQKMSLADAFAILGF